MKIVSITDSPVKTKRFQVVMDNGRKYNFGLKGGSTYIDHKDNKKRKAYWARHYANKAEAQLIDNLIPSPALFSAYLLWGESTDLDENIDILNDMFR